MKKKFICAVCGYIYEGENPPEKCPICKAPASKFSELKDDGDVTYATVHRIGDGKPEGVSEEMINDLRAHFNGECGEVGMYLAMARQADREGYPEIAEAFKRYAFEEADHASRFAELLGECVWDTKTNLEKRAAAEAGGTPRPIWRSALLPRLVLARISSVLPRTLRLPDSMLSTTPFTKWLRTRPVMVQALQDC